MQQGFTLCVDCHILSAVTGRKVSSRHPCPKTAREEAEQTADQRTPVRMIFSLGLTALALQLGSGHCNDAFSWLAGQVVTSVTLGQGVLPPGWHNHVCTTSVRPGTPPIHPAPSPVVLALHSERLHFNFHRRVTWKHSIPQEVRFYTSSAGKHGCLNASSGMFEMWCKRTHSG